MSFPKPPEDVLQELRKFDGERLQQFLLDTWEHAGEDFHDAREWMEHTGATVLRPMVSLRQDQMKEGMLYQLLSGELFWVSDDGGSFNSKPLAN